MSVPSSARDPQVVDSSFDARWDAWIERGRQHDQATNRRLRVILLSAAAIGVLVTLFNLVSRVR